MIIESDSLNSSMSWALAGKFPWRFEFYFNEIKVISFSIDVSF